METITELSEKHSIRIGEFNNDKEKSHCINLCHSLVEGMTPASFNKDWEPKKICLLRLIPRSYTQSDIASANKFEALQALKKITPLLQSGEPEKAELGIIEFFKAV